MDKLHAMNVFIKIVDTGSLTRAAESIGSSLPTVVRILATLEETLDVKLLRRTTRSIALTDEGKNYLQRCRQILADIEEAETELSAQHQEPKGQLTITAPSLFGQMHVNPLIVKFIQQHPQVDIDFLLADRNVNFIEEGIDAAIRFGKLSDSSLIALPIGHIRRVICASPKYLKKHGTATHPKELSEHSCIDILGINPGNHWHFYQNKKSLQVNIKTRYECNQAAATVAACADGIGYGMFHCYQVQVLVNEGKLKLVLESFEPPPTPVNIVYPHRKLLSARVHQFIHWMADELKKCFKVQQFD